MAWNNGGLNFARAIEHATQDLLQARERSFAGHIVGTLDLFLTNERKSPSHHIWSVMEGSLQCDFGIMKAGGIKFDLRSRGAAPKEVDGPTFANHIDGPLPRLGTQRWDRQLLWGLRHGNEG